MINLASIVLFSIFLLLSLVHFYWALGGKWGKVAAIPHNTEGEPLFKPGTGATVIVGMGLLAFGIYFLIRSAIIPIKLPDFLIKYAGWIIIGIFFIRAIGDFNYVGFFKKVTGTKFSSLDNRFYSPLCLVISILGSFIMLNSIPEN